MMRASRVLAALPLAAMGTLALHRPSPSRRGLEDPVGGKGGPDRNCTQRMLPRFLYLGMAHAGSTSLAQELDRHPQLSYGEAKEHRYWTKFGTHEYSSNIKEYEESFPVDCKVEKTFDATPNMFALPIKQPHEACHTVPGPEGKGRKAMLSVKRHLGNGTQLLVMLRDPIKVMQSRFQGRSWQQNADYAVQFCSCFYTGIVLWMKHFPANQFHFMRSEDFFQEPEKTLDEVFDFLGVQRLGYNRRQFLMSGRRRSTAQPPSSLHALRKYRKAIRPCRKHLEELTGLRLKWGRG